MIKTNIRCAHCSHNVASQFTILILMMINIVQAWVAILQAVWSNPTLARLHPIPFHCNKLKLPRIELSSLSSLAAGPVLMTFLYHGNSWLPNSTDCQPTSTKDIAGQSATRALTMTSTVTNTVTFPTMRSQKYPKHITKGLSPQTQPKDPQIVLSGSFALLHCFVRVFLTFCLVWTPPHFWRKWKSKMGTFPIFISVATLLLFPLLRRAPPILRVLVHHSLLHNYL